MIQVELYPTHLTFRNHTMSSKIRGIVQKITLARIVIMTEVMINKHVGSVV